MDIQIESFKILQTISHNNLKISYLMIHRMKKYEEGLGDKIGVIEQLGKKWAIQIILIIKKNKSAQFSYLQKSLGIPAKSLSLVLKSLTEKKIIQKTIIPNSPILILYSLTLFGLSILDAIKTFPSQNSPIP